MGLLAWLRRRFSSARWTREDTDAPRSAPPSPAPLAPAPLAAAPIAPAPGVVAPPEVAPPGAPEPTPPASSAQLTQVLDRALYRGAVVNLLVRTLKGATREAKTPSDRLFISILLRTITNDGINLPALPDVVLKIQQALGRSDCSTHELERVLICEPMVTTKMIAVASSPIYQRGLPVHGLHDAINRVGYRETKNVVMAILSKTRLFRVPGFEPQATALYRSSLAAALTMQVLARPLHLDPDDAFLAGLLHDVGELVLLNAASEVHRRSRGESRVAEETMTKLSAAMHAPLGALVAETWELEPKVVHAIEHHHHVHRAPGDAHVLANALVVADEIARLLLAHAEPAPVLGATPAFAALGLYHPELVIEEARAAFEAFEGGEDEPAPSPAAHDAPRAHVS